MAAGFIASFDALLLVICLARSTMPQTIVANCFENGRIFLGDYTTSKTDKQSQPARFYISWLLVRLCFSLAYPLVYRIKTARRSVISCSSDLPNVLTKQSDCRCVALVTLNLSSFDRNSQRRFSHHESTVV